MEYNNNNNRTKAYNWFSECFSLYTLSPFLLSLFRTDHAEFLTSNGTTGLSYYPNEYKIYRNLFLWIYAGDTVLMSETAEDLQK